MRCDVLRGYRSAGREIAIWMDGFGGFNDERTLFLAYERGTRTRSSRGGKGDGEKGNRGMLLLLYLEGRA